MRRVGVAVVIALSVPAAAVADVIAEGRALAFAADKGNCLACHLIPGGEQTGTVGPSLERLAERYSDRRAVEALIHDATRVNPATLMPPFGRYGILSRTEIARIVDFLYAP